jgi:hypothetical protein
MDNAVKRAQDQGKGGAFVAFLGRFYPAILKAEPQMALPDQTEEAE